MADPTLLDDILSFEHDPLGFVLFAFPWQKPGTVLEHEPGPRAWQRAYLKDLGEQLRTGVQLDKAMRGAIQMAVASGHDIGKSALVSWLILWALSTKENTRGVITANTETQLRTKTWPEVKKWHNLAINSTWFVCDATCIYSSNIKDQKSWRIDAIPWSVHNTEAFAGLHNKAYRILFIFDEASAIVDPIWEVTQGALKDEDTEMIWAVFGNPTRNTGRFRECFGRLAHRWNGRQIDSRDVEGVNQVEIKKDIEDYGVDSDYIKVRVRGMFPSASFKQFISVADVDRAYGKHLNEPQFDFAPKILTVDPAWEGDDLLVIALRQGLAFKILHTMPKNDNDITVANFVAMYEDEERADAVIIDGGYGTGIVSAGRTMGRRWQLVWFSEESPDPGCLNMRAYMWKQTRDWLKEGGAIPKDPELHDELIGPETVPRLDGKLQLESKKDMKMRGLRSPNKADALCLSFARAVTNSTKTTAARRPSFAAPKYDPLAGVRGVTR